MGNHQKPGYDSSTEIHWRRWRLQWLRSILWCYLLETIWWVVSLYIACNWSTCLIDYFKRQFIYRTLADLALKIANIFKVSLMRDLRETRDDEVTRDNEGTRVNEVLMGMLFNFPPALDHWEASIYPCMYVSLFFRKHVQIQMTTTKKSKTTQCCFNSHIMKCFYM